jgi:hypothetical protein
MVGGWPAVVPQYVAVDTDVHTSAVRTAIFIPKQVPS